jgi:hypothetical protein
VMAMLVDWYLYRSYKLLKTIRNSTIKRLLRKKRNDKN